jgi:hypothetical protein
LLKSHVRTFVTLVAVLMIFGAGSVASLAAQDGTLAQVRDCRQLGWQTLARSDSPGVSFQSQAECVTYGAQGGTIVDLAGIVIPAGATVTFTGDLRGCNASTASWSASNGSGGTFGSLPEMSSLWECGHYSNVVSINAQAGPFETAVVLVITLSDVTCGNAYTSNSDHANVTKTTTGYQVTILESGWDEERCSETGTRVVEPGSGNLNLEIVISS